MKNFGLIGLAGYVAPRHLKAIKDTGNNLVAAYDTSDAVGVVDRYFPNTDFFTDQSLFETFLTENKMDFLTVCSPNHLHYRHVSQGLKHNLNVICEKPLVLNPAEAYDLLELEKNSGLSINTILQLRLHPNIIELKKRVVSEMNSKIHDVELTYITPRGKWYHTSWKGDISKSGGIATNIGIHLFDLLTYLFGGVKQSIVHVHQANVAAGFLELENARIKWLLSTNSTIVPNSQVPLRSMNVSGDYVEFNSGFEELHTKSYQEILTGNGFGIETVIPSIEITHQIRHTEPTGIKADYHPLLKSIQNRLP
ncbi:MAG: Gfo/Idh/MocA family oxidoreductase [Bacteroidetes bacterium]|nr:Gfo/Idh/MocA family oxidoreductase [Bacteroidota bacterium]